MSQMVLTLNSSYEPMTVMPLKRALRLVLQQKAVIVEQLDDQPVSSATGSMPRPLVIRLVKFVKVPRRLKRKVTNTFLFARDNYRCQYCGKKDTELRKRDGLTRDHVQPQSRGGPNTWTNCVTACSSCNTKKADRTPAEAGLTLRSKPREPGLVELKWTVRRLTPIQRKYVTEFYGGDTAAALESD